MARSTLCPRHRPGISKPRSREHWEPTRVAKCASCCPARSATRCVAVSQPAPTLSMAAGTTKQSPARVSVATTPRTSPALWSSLRTTSSPHARSRTTPTTFVIPPRCTSSRRSIADRQDARSRPTAVIYPSATISQPIPMRWLSHAKSPWLRSISNTTSAG